MKRRTIVCMTVAPVLVLLILTLQKHHAAVRTTLASFGSPGKAGPELVLDLRVRPDTDMSIRTAWWDSDLELEHGMLALGEVKGQAPLFFSLRLSNAGDQPISSKWFSAYGGFWCELETPSGKIINPIEGDRGLNCGLTSDLVWNPGAEIIVHSFIYEYRVSRPPMNLGYCFEEPGTYTLTAKYRVMSADAYAHFPVDLSAYPVIESNPVRITVRPESAADRPGPTFEQVCRVIRRPGEESVTEPIVTAPEPGTPLAALEQAEPWLVSLRQFVLGIRTERQLWLQQEAERQNASPLEGWPPRMNDAD